MTRCILHVDLNNFYASVECIEKDDKKHRIIFRTTVTNQDDKLVTDGKARVMKR